MRASIVARCLVSAVVGAAVAGPLTAQQDVPSVPRVVTVGRGEVETKPDRAQVQFIVETRAPTAAAAASENGRRQRAVLDTLQRLGASPEQIQTSFLQVTPEMVYPGQGVPPRVSGYVARNSVRLEVLKLEQTGVLIDAGLAKGATGIDGLHFYSSTANESRREALARAVSAARQDAEAMVRAAGYQLGALLEITGNSSSDGPVLMRMDMLRSAPAPSNMSQTPVNPGVLKITEMVTVRWALKP